MNEKNNYKLYVIIALVSFILGATTIFFISFRQSNSLREQIDLARAELNQSREENRRLGIELDNARNINSELERTVSKSKTITRELRGSVGENIATIRQCIEIVHVIRTQIEDLQNCLNSVDTNNSSSNSDSLLQSDEVKEE